MASSPAGAASQSASSFRSGPPCPGGPLAAGLCRGAVHELAGAVKEERRVLPVPLLHQRGPLLTVQGPKSGGPGPDLRPWQKTIKRDNYDRRAYGLQLVQLHRNPWDRPRKDDIWGVEGRVPGPVPGGCPGEADRDYISYSGLGPIDVSASACIVTSAPCQPYTGDFGSGGGNVLDWSRYLSTFEYFDLDTDRFEKTRSAILFDRIQQVLVKMDR